MNYRELGKTGLIISEVGFGCIPIIRLNPQEAVDVLRHAFDRGITFFDTANAYRDSEQKVGEAFRGKRDKVILATKTGKRDAGGAAEHLENSLRMLKTDYIDLYQFHQVSKEKDWEALTGPGGAMETVLKAKEQGKIRHIGFTSHSNEMALKLVKTGLFETVMFPFSFIENRSMEELFRETGERGMGFLAMKPFGGGVIDNAGLSFKFLRCYPQVFPIPGFDSIEYVDQVLSIYEKPNMVTREDEALMEKYRQDLGTRFCRRCEYCQPCPNGVMITTAMGYPIVAKRMSPAVSVEFSKKAMDSVVKCLNCGVCLKRCPYELPIPEVLQNNYQMYREHLKVHKK